MPQLDISTYTSQLFWLTICFSFLYLMLKNKIIPQLKKLNQKRWEHTEGLHEKAKNLKEKAQKISEECSSALKNAHQSSNELINKTIKNSKTNISKKHSAFSKTIQKNFLDCKIKINKQEEEIQKEILKNLTPITVEVVKKISFDTISIKKIEKAAQEKLSNKTIIKDMQINI